MLGNAVKFNFPGINLPDSSADADGSRGWVQYTADIRDNMPWELKLITLHISISI